VTLFNLVSSGLSSAACPACLGTETTALREVRSDAAAQHFVLREIDESRHNALRSHIERLWGGPSCNLRSCAACGFVYCDPYVAGDARFYELAYPRGGYPSWRWEFGLALRAIPEHGSDAWLLEIGAGDGAFIKHVVPAVLPSANVMCLEYSVVGRAAVSARGVRCLASDVRDLATDEYAGVFDLVCMFQVLEHMDRLDVLFDHLSVITRPGASLFISVPNPERIAFNERHGGLVDMPPNHIGRWTRKSLEAVARRHRWTLVMHAVEPQRAASKLIGRDGLAVYRYLRGRQRSGSLPNRIERVRSILLRRLFQAALIGAHTIAALPLVGALRAPSLGATQCAQLRRS